MDSQFQNYPINEFNTNPFGNLMQPTAPVPQNYTQEPIIPNSTVPQSNPSTFNQTFYQPQISNPSPQNLYTPTAYSQSQTVTPSKTKWSKKEWAACLLCCAVILAGIIVGIIFLVKYIKAKKESSSTSSSSSSLSSQTFQIKSSNGTCLALNSTQEDDYIILKPSDTSDKTQFWQKVVPSGQTSFVIINSANNLAITINGGLGAIFASKNLNSSNQLWSMSGSNIVPYDKIYGPPTEPAQLVLATGTATTVSGYSQDQINAVLVGQIVQTDSKAQAALDAASGNSTVLINGLPATLLPISSTDPGQSWTFV